MPPTCNETHKTTPWQKLKNSCRIIRFKWQVVCREKKNLYIFSNSCRMLTTIEEKPKEPKTPMTSFASINEDLILNILKRLPALSFASAACVSKSWNQICNQILYKPKFASAFSLNPDEKVCWVFKKINKDYIFSANSVSILNWSSVFFDDINNYIYMSLVGTLKNK